MPIPSPGQNGGSKRILTPNTTSVALRDIRFTIDPKLVGEVGFEPTQSKTADLQSAPTLQLWRSPKKVREGGCQPNPFNAPSNFVQPRLVGGEMHLFLPPF